MPRNEHRSGRLTVARARAILALAAAAAGTGRLHAGAINMLRRLTHPLVIGSPAAILFAWTGAPPANADTLLTAYEGDVLPWEADFIQANPCDPPWCAARTEGGVFVLEWGTFADSVQYTNLITGPDDAPPASLWIEWRYRSNNPRPANAFGCDGFGIAQLLGFAEEFSWWGDGALSMDGGEGLDGLELDDFHTAHVELWPDFEAGVVRRRYALDGMPFAESGGSIQANNTTVVTFGGQGSCQTRPTPVINEWDFVRWGTLTDGEKLVAVSPRGGLLPQSDRFSVTFDQPHYAFVDEITVESTEPLPPIVTRTWRIDGQDSNSFEIGLDRAVEVGETITVTIGDPADGNVAILTGTEAGVPAVSTWGLAALALALCTAATIMVRPRHRRSNSGTRYSAPVARRTHPFEQDTLQQS